MALQSDQEFAPTQIARAVFPTAFRGYDQDAVRRYLSRLASALEHQQEYAGLGELEARTPAHERVEELENEAEDLRQEIRDLELELVQKSVDGHDNTKALAEPVEDAVPFDEHRAIELLGKETARVLESARSAAADILKRAETQAASLKAQAKSELAEARRRAESLVAEKKAETDELTARLTGEAQAEADRVAAEAEEHRAAVVEESSKILTEAEALAKSEQQDAEERAKQIVADAETLRQQVVSELVAERREAHVEMERMTSARDRLAMSLAVARSELDEVADALVGATVSQNSAKNQSQNIPGSSNSGPAVTNRSHREEVAGLIDQLEAEGPDGGQTETGTAGAVTADVGQPFFVDEVVDGEGPADPDENQANQPAVNRSKKRRNAKKARIAKSNRNAKSTRNNDDSNSNSNSNNNDNDDNDDNPTTDTNTADTKAKAAEAEAGSVGSPDESDEDVVSVLEIPIPDVNSDDDTDGETDSEIVDSQIEDPGSESVQESLEVIVDVIALDDKTAASDEEGSGEELSVLPADGQGLSLIEGFTTIDLEDRGSSGGGEVDGEVVTPDLVRSVVVNERHTPEEVITTVASRTSGGSASRTQGDLLIDRPFTGRLPKEFAAREVTLTRSGPNFRRQLRRALNDDQSDVLDRLRAGRGIITADELPEFSDQIDRYLAPLRRGLAEIAQAGAKAGGQADLSHAALDNLVRQLAKYIVDRVRVPTIQIIEADTDRDRERILEPVRALYRDFRNVGLAELSEDALYEAFAIGLYDSIEPSAPVSWRVDPRSDPDPICDINRQRTDVVKGATFPSGHARPLALPGCRCLVTVADY